MNKILGKFCPQIYALLRIIAGFLIACHGARTLFGVLGGEAQPLGSLVGVGGVIEFFGGLLIALGFFTSWAAFLVSGEMAVAYFKVHAGQGFWPIQNHGELAVIFCFVFLYIACHGAGVWSVAGALKKPGWE